MDPPNPSLISVFHCHSPSQSIWGHHIDSYPMNKYGIYGMRQYALNPINSIIFLTLGCFIAINRGKPSILRQNHMCHMAAYGINTTNHFASNGLHHFNIFHPLKNVRISPGQAQELPQPQSGLDSRGTGLEIHPAGHWKDWHCMRQHISSEGSLDGLGFKCLELVGHC